MRTKAIDVNVEELRTSKVLCREKANELEGSWNKKDIASRHLKWKNSSAGRSWISDFKMHLGDTSRGMVPPDLPRFLKSSYCQFPTP